jgi:hypothetical protein
LFAAGISGRPRRDLKSLGTLERGFLPCGFGHGSGPIVVGRHVAPEFVVFSHDLFLTRARLAGFTPLAHDYVRAGNGRVDLGEVE